ncbi:DUF6701 domain-containing protein [Vibrio gigantis]|uniref:DUF6701 domain-containing protein n=1 Tax=Vibrio gigantis TaxID=296199 RepID=UPI0035A5CB8F
MKNITIKIKVLFSLSLLLFPFSSHAKPKYYDLNVPDDFKHVCKGTHWVSGSPKIYHCDGEFKVNNAVISLDGSSKINAYGGYDIKSSTIEPTSGYVELQSNNWSGDTVLQSTVLIGSISVPYAISISDSMVERYVENTTNHDVNISGSVIGEYVDAGTTITIDDSEVIGNVFNRGNNDISVLNDSEIGGYVDGGTTVKIDASDVNGNVSNRSNNDISVLNESEVGGNIYGGTTINIDDSEVGGNVSNRSNNEIKIVSDSTIGGNVIAQGKLLITNAEVDGNIQSINHDIYLDESAEIHGDATAADNNWSTIYFNDYDGHDSSVVHGKCLYRTEPEDACGPTEPPVNRNPQFEFGTLTAATDDNSRCEIIEPQPNDSSDRQKVKCTLTYENTYDTSKPKPLVFIMPTIDASLSVLDEGTTELPSTASVISTDWTSATIIQEIAPSSKRKNKGITYLDAPMVDSNDKYSHLNIDYFVIEEGVITLGDKAKIVAGSISTNVAASRDNPNRKVTVNYSNYGLPSDFINTPGVLVQPQIKSSENSNKWFTGMARNVGKDQFFLSLEKSEVTSNNTLSEVKVGFVAGEGNGFIQGARFWLGDGKTLKTTELSEKVISPIEQGCLEYTDISFAGFDAPPILVANKNSRDGNNGGWLRRCDVKNNKAFFVVEEDMDRDSERGHVKEEVGFFMFDRPNELGICEGFNNKSPVQTWLGSGGTLELNSSPGSSPKIVGALREDGQRYVGFLDTNTFDRTNSACEGQKCLGLDDLLINKEALEDVPDNLGNALDIPFTHNVTSLPITVGGVKVYEYDSITIGNGGIVEIEEGKYKIGKLDINGTGQLKVKTGDTVTIFTKDLSVNNNGYAGIPIVNSIGEKPVLAADTHFRVNVLTNGANHVRFNGDGATFVGLVYSEQLVDLSGSAKVYGAVSAQNINMSSSALVHAETSCIVPADDYGIDISPETDLALMCGDDSPQFTITTSNNGVAESLSVTVAITPHPNYFEVSAITGSGSYPNYSSNIDGDLTLKITAKDSANIDFDDSYKLTATLVDDVNQSVESLFKFVPFRFSLFDGDSPSNRLNVIAGQATSADTRVLACDSNNTVTVAKNYNIESEDVVGVSYQLNSPSEGIKGQLTYTPTYTNGVSDSPLTITESGIFDIQLSDTFDCDGFEGCPDSGNYDLKGFFSVYSRPWKVAICDVKAKAIPTNLNPSTTTQTQGFMASGETFSVTYKPVQFGVSIGADACALPTTFNYATEKGSLIVSRELVYPDVEQASIGNLADEEETNFSGNQTGIKTLDYSWDEVGSINFVTSSDEHPIMYLGHKLDSHKVLIGRFYPKYFLQDTNEWIVEDQNNVAYLSQPYDSAIHKVYPMASGQGDIANALNNYRFFNTDLQASFGILDDTSIDNDFLLDTDTGTWSADRKHWLLNDNAAELQRVTGSDDVSRKDGPFNTSDASSIATNFGLTVTGVDPVSFTDSDPVTDSAAFPVQPPARYGRMALDDIGGNSNTTLTIPLRVEFWNGSEFVLNTDDSYQDDQNKRSSSFNGANYCKQVIWHSAGKTVTSATLSGLGNVKKGEEEVTTSQNTPTDTDAPREQVRLWLRMGDSEPDSDGGNNISCSGSDQDQPWLRYNWRQLGDEDPSTVVTFGIYRGNDRVIYRGESGLTGQ